MVEDGCTVSLGIAGDSVGRLDQRRCALPPCSPSGIIHPNGVIFLLQEGTAAGGTQGFSRGTSWAASTSRGASKPRLTPRLCHPALCISLPLLSTSNKHCKTSPWSHGGAGLALRRRRGQESRGLGSPHVEVFGDPCSVEPALISQHLQIQALSAVSCKPLHLVAPGRRIAGAAGNLSGGTHPGQGTLVLSALASSIPTSLSPTQMPRI